MIPSRQQAALGPYGPLLSAGLYPTPPVQRPAMAAPGAPQAPSTPSAPSAAPMQPAPAPQAPAPAQDAAPGVQFGGSYDGGDKGEPSQDRGFAQEIGNFGTIGAIGGGLLGMGLGVPGIGSALGALGTAVDVSQLNGLLGEMQMPQEIDTGRALANSMSFGLAGQSAKGQFGEIATRGMDFANDGFLGLGEVAPMDQITDASGLEADPSKSVTDGGMKDGFGADFGGDFGGFSEGGVAGDKGDAGPGADGGDKGFKAGGYTGAGHDGEVDPSEPAGTVHEGEVVIPAHAVQHYGLDLLMGLVSKQVPRSRLAELARD